MLHFDNLYFHHTYMLKYLGCKAEIFRGGQLPLLQRAYNKGRIKTTLLLCLLSIHLDVSPSL